MDSILLVFYFTVLGILGIYGAHRYELLYLFRRHRSESPLPVSRFEELPAVTVQLPIFNEYYVVERLIDAVCRLDYPRDRLQIQVLDDSTDETQDRARRKVEEYRSQGIQIEYLHRDEREGFKAGALRHGLARARGEFIAIFDADFVPDRRLLFETIHYFTDPGIGLIQTRWGHLNRDYSLLTRVQSMFLDGHFVIEHTARNRSGRFFNFNGTAGVWRRSCIEDAGGWHHDTLTEDLDLSYRAQLRGWKFLFLCDVVSPAELPVEMNAYKNQQYRWTKGAAQTLKKVIPQVWKSAAPLKVKLEATFHLGSNFAYPLMVLMSILMLPTLQIRLGLTSTIWALLFDLSLFWAATISICFFYVQAQRHVNLDWRTRLKYLPFVLATGIGLSVSNTRAVLEGLLGFESPFERTPKYAVSSSRQDLRKRRYAGRKTLVIWAELVLAAYSTATLLVALSHELYVTAFFLLFFVVGFSYVGGASLIERWNSRPPVIPEPARG